MKKFLVVILFLTQIFALNYDEALKYYNKHQYKKAYLAFLELCQKDFYQDSNLNFYLGLSAEKVGRYNEAIAAFERILFYHPNNLRAFLELGKIYFELHQYSNSLNYFHKSLKLTDNKNVIKHINEFIKKIQQAKQKDFLTLNAILSFGVDSNINYTSNTSNYTIYINNSPITIKNNNHKTKAIQMSETLMPSYKHKFNNFDFQNNFIIFNSNTYNHSNQNLQLFSYSPMFVKNSLKAGLNYSYMRYGNKAYLYMIGASINFVKKINETTLNSVNLKYYLKNYILEKNKKRDSNNYVLENKLIKFFNKQNSLYLTLKFLTEREKHHELTTVNKNQFYSKLSYNINLSKFNFSFPIEYQKENYLDKDAFFKKKRKDNMLSYGININKKFQKFTLQTSFKYINNHSNIKIYTYDKWLFNVSFIKKFKGL